MEIFQLKPVYNIYFVMFILVWYSDINIPIFVCSLLIMDMLIP